MLRTLLVLQALVCAATAFAQDWRTAYEQGLDAAKAKRWAQAREAFVRASAARPGDTAAPTPLRGPVSERRLWRSGAPYSPHFLAAYSGYQQALAASSDEAKPLLEASANELEGLLAKGQHSFEAYYVLARVYNALGNTEKRVELEDRAAANVARMTFKVDAEAVTPEERALLAEARTGTPGVGGLETAKPVNIKAGDPAIAVGASPGRPTPLNVGGVSRVQGLPSKYALVIGNAEGRLPDATLPFASDDAQRVREALVLSAGYPEENVDLVLNATASQISASARALAERVEEGSTVFLYFSGAGANLDGKDYFAGIDTELATDTSTMIAKNDVFRMFMAKGARIFAFFQTNRPVSGGRYFGSEVPLFGSISQVQATLPGEGVHSVIKNGKQIGLFTDALASVIDEFRSNRIPILEFGWQVFYKIRRGDTGSTGGGSRQTPTLPVLSNMASDARF